MNDQILQILIQKDFPVPPGEQSRLSEIAGQERRTRSDNDQGLCLRYSGSRHISDQNMIPCARDNADPDLVQSGIKELCIFTQRHFLIADELCELIEQVHERFIDLFILLHRRAIALSGEIVCGILQ